MRQMQDDEARMAGCIADLQAAMAAMSEDPCNRSRLYLTDRELAALPCMAHDTVFAVRSAAAPNTIHQCNRRCNIKQMSWLPSVVGRHAMWTCCDRSCYYSEFCLLSDMLEQPGTTVVLCL
jgi:hypothetical protein